MKTQADITLWHNRYGINGELTDQLSSITNEEILALFNRSDIEGGATLITYNPAAPLAEQIVRVRLNNPIRDTK